MPMYAPTGTRQYSETLPKAPGQPGFRPTQPQTDFSKKMPGAPGSSLDNARRAGPMTQGQAIPGMPQQQSGGYSSPPYMPQTQTVPMPQAPAQGFTQTTSPAMMLGPQSPAPVAPMYGGSQGYMNPATSAEQGAAGQQFSPNSAGWNPQARANLASSGSVTGTVDRKNFADQGEYDRIVGMQNDMKANGGQLSQQWQQADAARRSAYNAGTATDPGMMAQYAARGIGPNGQPQFGGEAFDQNWTPQDAQLRQQMQPVVQQMRTRQTGQNMTPLQQMVRNRGAGGGDFVGQWTPPPKFASQRPSPLLQQLGV